MQKSDLLYPRVQQVLPLLQTSFNLLVSDFGGAKCNLSRSAGDTALAGAAAIQQGLETLEKPTGTSRIPSQVQCWCPQYRTRTHRSNSSEGPRRWFRDWSKRLSELGWSRGSSQWCSGMAKSHQARGEIWSCVSAQEKGVKPRISLPSEVVESPSLEIFQSPALAPAGIGLDNLQRCLQHQPLWDSGASKEMNPLSDLIFTGVTGTIFCVKCSPCFPHVWWFCTQYLRWNSSLWLIEPSVSTSSLCSFAFFSLQG